MNRSPISAGVVLAVAAAGGQEAQKGAGAKGQSCPSDGSYRLAP
ncbi:MAG TPA: hypothetical protein VNO21_02520 [Polyangiaceae bacterium]|nr:hypothetical protein [Polyangiaceae bacterium]